MPPDGATSATIEQLYFDGTNSVTPLLTTITGDGTAGKATTVDVDFEIAGTSTGNPTLVVTGTIDALGCPARRPRSRHRRSLPPCPATITVAGKQLPVRFAKLKSGEKTELTL